MLGKRRSGQDGSGRGPRLLIAMTEKELRGMSGCSYSSRRLFFGSKGTLFTDLEWLWYAGSSGKVLRTVFS